MEATLTGVITDIFPSEQYNALVKRCFWLQELNKTSYQAQIWELTLLHDDFVTLIDKFKVGDSVVCNVKILGKRWKDRVITTLKCEMIKNFNN
jgi:hypothetical protein